MGFDGGIPDMGFDGGIPDMGFDGGIPGMGFDGGIPDMGFDDEIPDMGFDGGASFDDGGMLTDGGDGLSMRASMPTPRASHACVWTSGPSSPQMLVWGGAGSTPSNYAPSTVLAYDPAGDTWSTSGVAAPIGGRVGMGAVWTGSRLFVWGGVSGSGPSLTSSQDGFLYDPEFDTFIGTAMSGAPSAREQPVVVWTGSKVVVWGGRFTSAFQSFSLGDGALYDPATNTWTPIASVGAPPHRYGAAFVWTGSELVVWGGFQKTIDSSTIAPIDGGARYDPASNAWYPFTAFGEAPAPRGAVGTPMAVWTGAEMMIWGGGADPTTPYASGGRLDDATSTWMPLSEVFAPAARERAIQVWTGTELVVQGGFFGATSSFTGSGGAYDPGTDSWRAIPSGPPSASACAVYTGSQVIVTGGQIAPTANSDETRVLALGLAPPGA